LLLASQFAKICDEFNIPEAEHMPASKYLLSTFVTTHRVGSVSKGAIKTWFLGLELWHCNSSPWLRNEELQ